MRKVWFLLGFLFLISCVSAEEEVRVYYFYSTGCSHCADVVDSGVLDDVALIEGVSVERFNLYESQENRNLFNDFCDEFEISRRGWPFAVIEKDGGYGYLSGDVPIIENLLSSVQNGGGIVIDVDGISEEYDEGVTINSVLIAAFIDSINPCAFGVLIFLMASLLGMGSARRALRAGLIYSFVVFVVYFFMGWGLYSVIFILWLLGLFLFWGFCS